MGTLVICGARSYLPLWLALALLAACGSPPAADEAVAPGQAPTTTVPEDPQATHLADGDVTSADAPHRPCRMAFDPDPELLAATEAAADRWAPATGCDVRVEAGGVPVRAMPRIFIADDEQVVHGDDPNGDRHLVCGVTQHRWDVGAWAIHVATDSPPCTRPLDEVVAHEVGHAFGPPATHAEGGLSADSNAPRRTSLISDETLEWACSYTDCLAFAPESP
jgi:hypothetical protein